MTDVSEAKMKASRMQKSPAITEAQAYSESPCFQTGTPASE